MPPLSDSLNLYFVLSNNCTLLYFACFVCCLVIIFLQGTAEKFNKLHNKGRTRTQHLPVKVQKFFMTSTPSLLAASSSHNYLPPVFTLQCLTGKADKNNHMAQPVTRSKTKVF